MNWLFSYWSCTSISFIEVKMTSQKNMNLKILFRILAEIESQSSLLPEKYTTSLSIRRNPHLMCGCCQTSACWKKQFQINSSCQGRSFLVQAAHVWLRCSTDLAEGRILSIDSTASSSHSPTFTLARKHPSPAFILQRGMKVTSPSFIVLYPFSGIPGHAT